jgi:hypothetical protein
VATCAEPGGLYANDEFSEGVLKATWKKYARREDTGEPVKRKCESEWRDAGKRLEGHTVDSATLPPATCFVTNELAVK